MEIIIQNLSNVYITLQDIEVKGKQALPMGMSLRTLENEILKLKEILKNELEKQNKVE